MPAPTILSSQTPILDTAAPVTAALAPSGSPFDAILMLEELAATLVPDATGIAAGAAELGSEAPESCEELDGEDSIEDTDEESEDLLAFLAGMIATSPLPPQGRTDPADAGSSGEGGETEMAAGGEAAKGRPAKAPTWPLSTDSLAAKPVADPDPTATPTQNLTPGPATAPTPTARNDAEAAARAFAAITQAEPVRATEETGAPARATDFLTHAPRGAPAHAPEQSAVATHVRDPRWADDFGTRIVTLVNQRESIASISLNPLDLGPVDVSVTVKDTQATIHFGAAQADTRALLEASLPRLRELLAAQGFQLMDASVSQGFTRQSKPDAPSVPRPSTVDEVTPTTKATTRVVGLLDTYA